MTSIKFSRLIGTICGVMVVCSASHAAVMIDNFSQGNVNISAGGDPAAPSYAAAIETGLLPDNTIGGARQTHVQRGFGFFDYASATLTAGQLWIDMDNDSQSWIDYAAIGGRDFLTEGIAGISLNIVEHSVADLVVTLNVVDNVGNYATATSVMGNVGFGVYQTSGILSLNFAQLSGSVDLSHIDRLGVSFAGTDDGTIVIEDIVAFTPEPSSAFAVIVLVCGISLGYRRRSTF